MLHSWIKSRCWDCWNLIFHCLFIAGVVAMAETTPKVWTLGFVEINIIPNFTTWQQAWINFFVSTLEVFSIYFRAIQQKQNSYLKILKLDLELWTLVLYVLYFLIMHILLSNSKFIRRKLLNQIVWLNLLQFLCNVDMMDILNVQLFFIEL